MQNLRPLFDAQLSLAKALSCVYRVSIGPRGGRSDPELVTNQDGLHEAVQAIHAGGGYGEIAEDEGGEDGEAISRRYYFLTTKAPDGRSIDSLIKGAIRFIFTLNTPPKSHWIIKRFFDLEATTENGFYRPKLKADVKDAIYIPGTYRDNLPNLDPHTVQRYESYKQSKPAYYYQMIEGLCPETVMGKIYSGWKEIDEVPPQARIIGRGLDFDFDPDPVAAFAAYWYNGGIILDEELYQTQLINEHLATTIKAQPNAGAPVVANSAEPKSIAELQGYGLNVMPCEKGPDGVDFGIRHVQSLPISYTKRSMNIKTEVDNYAWLIDKRTGENRGIEDSKCANHLMCAARYLLTTLVPPGAIYDPAKPECQRVEVSVTRRKLTKNQAR